MAPTTADDVPTLDEVPLRARGWGIPILLAAVVMIAVVVLGVVISSTTQDDDTAAGDTQTFVVPEGTSEKVYRGEVVDIMPPEVRLDVGDTLVVRNDDVETVTVGPFTVRAGETLTQQFRRPQTLIGECTLSGSGEIQIIVT
jgi:hypothetical protein